MIGRPKVIIQIPDKRKFSMAEAAKYLGMHQQTLREKSDLGEIYARKEGRSRVFLLEDLDRYIDRLPEYEPGERIGSQIKPELRAVGA